MKSRGAVQCVDFGSRRRTGSAAGAPAACLRSAGGDSYRLARATAGKGVTPLA